MRREIDGIKVLTIDTEASKVGVEHEDTEEYLKHQVMMLGNQVSALLQIAQELRTLQPYAIFVIVGNSEMYYRQTIQASPGAIDELLNAMADAEARERGYEADYEDYKITAKRNVVRFVKNGHKKPEQIFVFKAWPLKELKKGGDWR